MKIMVLEVVEVLVVLEVLIRELPPVVMVDLEHHLLFLEHQ